MKYTSRYSPGKQVSETQYITELICEKRAKSLNRDLPIKFWKLEEWKKYYQYQIMQAANLLKKYSSTSIISALHDKRTTSVFSLRNIFLENIIKEYEKREKNK